MAGAPPAAVGAVVHLAAHRLRPDLGNQGCVAPAPPAVGRPALQDRPPAGRGRGQASDRVRNASVARVGLLEELGPRLLPLHDGG